MLLFNGVGQGIFVVAIFVDDTVITINLSGLLAVDRGYMWMSLLRITIVTICSFAILH